MHSQLPLCGCAHWILTTGGMRFDMRVLVPNSARLGSVHQSVRETMNTRPVANRSSGPSVISLDGMTCLE